MRIVLGVGGGIAAYKVPALLRLLTEAGHDVTAVPTRSALEFVGTATWEALSGHPVRSGVFEDVDRVNHVRLGHEADLVVVAPATADLLARAAAGLADDLLTNTLLMARGPVVLVPAMHTEMWNHPATVANVQTLRERGVTVLEPATGRLTGADSGPGRMPEPEQIYIALLPHLEPEAPGEGPLAGRRITISAGGTREPLDPVRFLGNRSSGRQGVALARAALKAGATVHLVAAHLDVPPPSGITVTTVDTALEMRTAVLDASRESDAVIMAAAVADFRPAQVSDTKIKKRSESDDPVITLIRNPDILRDLVDQRGGSRRPAVVVGFAAETGDSQGDVLDYGRDKLRRKGCELMVVNRVGDGLVFGQEENDVVILSSNGAKPFPFRGSKDAVAEAILARVAQELAARA